MKKIFIIVSFMALGILNSCKKDKDVPVYILTQEAKDWMYYKEGTWWKYNNMNFGIVKLDSVIQNFIDTLEIYTRKDQLESRRLRAKMRVKDSYSNGIADWTTTGVSDFSSDAKKPLLFLSHSSDNSNLIYVFYLPLLEGYEKDIGFAKVIMEELIDTMVVSGKTYNNAVKMRITKNPMSGGYETVQYFVKHVGIIRTEVKVVKDIYGLDYEWQVWDLVDYHVVQ